MFGWILRKMLGIPKAPSISSATTPGAETSEGRIAIWNTVIASVLAVFAIFWPDLPREEIRTVLLWVAAILGAFSSGSYSIARTQLKTALSKNLQKLERERIRAGVLPDSIE